MTQTTPIPTNENHSDGESLVWKVTIQASALDFMQLDDESQAGCNCDCNCGCNLAPLPSAPRRPRAGVRGR